MYKIEKLNSGYVLKFSGTIEAREMQKWYDESNTILSKHKGFSCGTIIDITGANHLSGEAISIMIDGQRLYKEKGMSRVAVILNDTSDTEKINDMSMIVGIYNTVRYIYAKQHTDPIHAAMAWVKNNTDPERLRQSSRN